MQLDGISGLLTITLTITTQDAFPSQALYAVYSSVSPKTLTGLTERKMLLSFHADSLLQGKLTDEFKFPVPVLLHLQYR